MLTDRGFPTDVAVARELFQIAADRAGLRVDGLDGEPGRAAAALDWVRLGAPAAKNLLVIGTGAVGRGSFAAAGAATHLLEGPIRRMLPAGVQALLIHAANPAGPLWTLGELPPAPPLPQRADPVAQAGTGWTSTLLANAERRFRDFQHASRMAEDAAERQSGQAMLPAFSSSVLDIILAGFDDLPQRAVLLDLRPGHGPFGRLSILAAAPAAGDAAMAAHRLFDAELPSAGQMPRSIGGLADHMHGVHCIPLIAEVGTRSTENALFTAFGAGHGDPISSNMDWRADFLAHAQTLTGRAINRLEAPW